MSTLARALAPFCGVLLGVMVYANYLSWWWPSLLGIIGLLAFIVGRLAFARRPRLSALILTPWILFGIVLLSAVTWIMLWLALHSSIVFPYVTADEQKELASAFTGALTVFFGVLFTKNLEEGGGFFWPGTHFKALAYDLSARLNEPQYQQYKDNELTDALVENSVREDGPRKRIEGWGLKARLVRARIIKDYLLKPPGPPAVKPAPVITEAPIVPLGGDNQNPTSTSQPPTSPQT